MTDYLIDTTVEIPSQSALLETYVRPGHHRVTKHRKIGLDSLIHWKLTIRAQTADAFALRKEAVALKHAWLDRHRGRRQG